MKDIEKLEKRLWEAADQLRANSKLFKVVELGGILYNE